MESQSARILLVSDDEGVRTLVRLTLSPQFEVVGEAADGLEGLRLLRELQPDLTLLDLDSHRQDGLQTIMRLRAAVGDSGVIVLSARGTMEIIRSSLAAGAQDFVKKPFEAGELRRIVADAASLQRRRKALLRTSSAPPGAGIWAFCRALGGSGQTTFLLSLADELVRMKKRVLLVDLHPHFGHLGFYLGLNVEGPDLADFAEFPAALTVGTVGDLARSHASGLKVICSPQDLVRGHSLDTAHLIEKVLALPGIFDYVLIDLPAGVPDAFLPILDAARYLFLVSHGGLSSLKNTKELFEIFRRLEYPITKLRPVVVGFHGESSVQVAFEKVMEKASPGILKRLPDCGEQAREAVGLGQPIPRLFPRSQYTAAVQSILAPLLEVSLEEVGQSNSKGVISSLFGRLFGSG